MHSISPAVVLVLSAAHAPWAVAQGIPDLREVRLGPEPGRILAPPAFHERGWHIACVVSAAGGQRVYHDGVLVGAVYDQIAQLKLSPDGSRVAYAARRGDKWCVVVDGQPRPGYDTIVRNGPSFRPDGTLEWLAVRDGDRYRVMVARRAE